MSYLLPNDEALIIFRREIQDAHVSLRLDSNFFGLKQVDKPIIVLEFYGCKNTDFIEYSCKVGWAFEYDVIEQTSEFTTVAVYNGGEEETITCSKIRETKFDYSIDDWRYKCQWLSQNCLELDNSLAFKNDLYAVFRNDVSEAIAQKLEQCQKKIELGHKSSDEALVAQVEAYSKALTTMGRVKGQPVEKLLRKWENLSTTPDTEADRRMLMREIVATGEVTVFPLMEKLTHQDWIVRESAVMMLGQIKDKKAWHPLVYVMVTDKIMSIRYRAFIALKRMEYPKWLESEQNKIELSKKEKLGNLLSEWQVFDETDPKVMQRVNELARKNECSPENIISSWFQQYGVLNPSVKVKNQIISITTEEAGYLEDATSL